MRAKEYLDILKEEVIPALGCTEPIAVALASAAAKNALNEEVESIDVLVSRNILKNGMAVGIPGTGLVGIDVAAALGAIGGNSNYGLEVLKSVTEEDIAKAKEFIKDKKVNVSLKDTDEKLYIEVICKNKNDDGRAVIKKQHTNIVIIEKNEKVLFECSDGKESTKNNQTNREKDMTIKGIYDFATTVPFEDIEFILKGAEMNKKVAGEGLKSDYGLRVGKTLMKNINNGILNNSLEAYIIATVTAAVDARMDGCIYPVMTTAGSGNQGLTAFLPSVAMAEKLKYGNEKLARALVISTLSTIHIKSFIGRLSALCGCGVAASIGSCSALTYLLGGDYEAIVKGIKNMIGDVSGMICDGAKPGCALKISTAVSAAVQCALLAKDGVEISSHDGIIHRDVEQTIKNLGLLGSNGMVETDKVILDMMVCK